MSWTSPVVVAKQHSLREHEKGVFALRDIKVGDIVGVFDGRAEVFDIDPDSGRVDYREWEDGRMVLQLALRENKLYGIVPLSDGPGGIDYINHSCSPNCSVYPGFVVTAVRPIKAGDELTVDYRTMDHVQVGKPCWCNKPESQKCIL